MEPAAYLTTLRADAEKAAAAAENDLATPVPSCPDWDLGELIVHLGRVHRWAAEIVRTRATARPDRFPARPGSHEHVADWLRAGADDLVEVLASADPADKVWNWGDGTVAFWCRRQAQETAMHRWDAQRAVGDPDPIQADLAADGVDEVLSMLAGATAGRPTGDGGTIHLHATDRDCEWTITLTPSGIAFEPGHAQGDAALRASASDLLLWCWNRIDADAPGLDVFGDRALLDHWREVAKI